MKIIPLQSELIPSFVRALNDTKELINKRDQDGAKEKYVELLDLYNQISSSSLEGIHKKIAYDQLTKVYERLAKPERSSQFTIVLAGTLLVVLSIIAFVKPEIIGAAIFQEVLVENLNWAFTGNDQVTMTLKGEPLALKLTGSFTGEGNARVYAQQDGGQKLLIFDSKKSKLDRGVFFERSCLDTCLMSGSSNTVDILIEVNDAILSINELEYAVRAK